ncbi:ankyrin repeat domain-containing protein 53 [Spea bombifrons]|uniref:ankyrin repeat domain-containing protein 53 n=1 Tax=Spea bombifrons TaxID=233779 RepID=UPI002349D2F5|nr:ankyrin repeat domain-containing protein 53 [Spea bombifrons]
MSGSSSHKAPVRPALDNLTSDQLMAATLGNVDWLKLSLANAGSELKADRYGFTAVHTAARQAKLQCLKLLAERYNVNLNLPTRLGRSPLHLTLNQKNGSRALDCVRFLIGRGADVNAKDRNGVTPLHLAAREGLQECLVTLVEAGGDVYAKDTKGLKPIDLCKIHCHRDCARYLKSVMWKKEKESYARDVKKMDRLVNNIYETEQETRLNMKKREELLRQSNFSQWIDAKGFPETIRQKYGCRERDLSESKPLRCCHSKSSDGYKDSDAKSSKGEKLHLQKGDKTKTPGSSTRFQSRRSGTLSCNWNRSVNPSMPPATSISRRPTLRLGAEPEEPIREDFSAYVSIIKDSGGNRKIRTASGRVATPPSSLPYEVIERKLFPGTVPRGRIRMPQEFKSTHVFELPKKHQPACGPHNQPEIEFHLRQTYDSQFKKMAKERGRL